VVVLGPAGRNFGAGMSGGIAYVYDADGEFPTRVNYEMVALEDLDDDDRETVHSLVLRHRDETGSALAARLLADTAASDGVVITMVMVGAWSRKPAAP